MGWVLDDTEGEECVNCVRGGSSTGLFDAALSSLLARPCCFGCYGPKADYVVLVARG